MAEKGRKRSVAGKLIFVLVLAALVGGGIYYYLQSKTPDYSITFYDAKQVPAGAKVFMAGVEIGRIVSIEPSGTGVAVGIKVDRQYRDNLTEDSRFFLDPSAAGGRMLVKNLSARARPLRPGQTVQGTDSAFQWRAYDFAKGMNEILGAGQVDQAQETMRSYVEEMNRQLRQMDWDKLGRDMQRQMEEFSRELNEALNEEDLRELRREMEKSYDEARAALDRLQNSPEARKLREAVENFYRKLQEEAASKEGPDRETP